jgi:hypothetical protein
MFMAEVNVIEKKPNRQTTGDNCDRVYDCRLHTHSYARWE